MVELHPQTIERDGKKAFAVLPYDELQRAQEEFEDYEDLRQLSADAWRLTMDSKHEMVIYWSQEDGAFVVEVPELPGCMADGATYDEAAANAQVIIREWLETATQLGRPIPQPKGRLVFA